MRPEPISVGNVQLYVNRLSAFEELPLWTRLTRIVLVASAEVEDPDTSLDAMMLGTLTMMDGDDLQDLVGELLKTSIAVVKNRNGQEKQIVLGTADPNGKQIADREAIDIAFFGENTMVLIQAALAAARVRFGRFFGVPSVGRKPAAGGTASESTSPKTSAESG